MDFRRLDIIQDVYVSLEVKTTVYDPHVYRLCGGVHRIWIGMAKLRHGGEFGIQVARVVGPLSGRCTGSGASRPRETSPGWASSSVLGRR